MSENREVKEFLGDTESMKNSPKGNLEVNKSETGQNLT